MKGKIVIIDGTEFDEYEVNTGKQIAVVRERIITEEEITEQANQQRISELKQIIDNKNYLGDDVTEERAELRTLLGM